jgi:OOP family OmpA-OmpF porin
MDQAPVQAAKSLISHYGDRLCIDTVQVGDNTSGKVILEKISGVSSCGFSTTVDRLVTPSNMRAFVEDIFLNKHVHMAAELKPIDKDKDGVSDNLDQCPDTPNGATVDDRGCWRVALFYFDSTKVKPEVYPMLQEAVLMMKKNPDLKVEIDGHTCSIGPEEYNMTLSVKRAEAVKNHFVSRGIDSNRLTTKGFGLTKPAASNDTKEGRAKNRRVELTPVN